MQPKTLRKLYIYLPNRKKRQKGNIMFDNGASENELMSWDQCLIITTSKTFFTFLRRGHFNSLKETFRIICWINHADKKMIYSVSTYKYNAWFRH